MEDSVSLSRMPCYAGLQRAEVIGGEPYRREGHPDLDPYFYLQFVEGCGYTVYEITPDEADKLAAILTERAKYCRQAYADDKVT